MSILCHICLLPIPDHLVNPGHPLFGTRDHVIPKSKGGRGWANLAPAHRYCNPAKGCGEVTSHLMLKCGARIRKELAAIGIVPAKPSKAQFQHLHAMIEYLCVELDARERELSELYRQRGWCQ